MNKSNKLKLPSGDWDIITGQIAYQNDKVEDVTEQKLTAFLERVTGKRVLLTDLNKTGYCGFVSPHISAERPYTYEDRVPELLSLIAEDESFRLRDYALTAFTLRRLPDAMKLHPREACCIVTVLINIVRSGRVTREDLIQLCESVKGTYQIAAEVLYGDRSHTLTGFEKVPTANFFPEFIKLLSREITSASPK